MALDPITKDLQQESNKKFNPPQPSPGYQFLQERGLKLAPYEDLLGATEGPTPELGVDIPESTTRRLGRFYNPIGRNVMEDLAQDQSVAERLAYLIPRVGVKVLSETAQLPGYIGGLIDWGLHGFDSKEIGRMVDNQWITAVQDLEPEIKDKLPVFTPEAVQNGNLWDNITSSSFWANEGADGVGFLLAMLIPGRILKSAKLGEGLAALPKLFKPGFQASAKAAQAINTVAAASINTAYEAATEAGDTYRQVVEEGGGKEAAGKAAAGNFRANMGILFLPNLLEQIWLFEGFKGMRTAVTPKALKGKSKLLGRILDPATGVPLSTVAERAGVDKVGEAAIKSLKGVVSEGFFEEGLQFASSKHFVDLAKQGKSEDAFGNFMGVLQTYVDNLSDVEMQKNILLGAVMGGGMAAIGASREVRGQERLIKGTTAAKRSSLGKFIGLQDRAASPGLHELFKRNYVSRFRTLKDMAKVDSDGKPIIKSDGTYDIDPQKMQEYLASNMQSEIYRSRMAEFARLGDEEAFEWVKDQLDFKYMMPYLQQEGGLEVLKNHVINFLAEKDAEHLEAEYGIKPESVEEMKQTLLEKADRYQKIYDRIADTHNMNLRIKYNPEDKEKFIDFSEVLKNSKLSEAAKQSHAQTRIDRLGRKLNDFRLPEVNPESTGQDIDNLEKSGKIDKAESLALKQIVKDIETHKAEIKKSQEVSKKLYNNKDQQKSFEDYIKKSKDLEDRVHEGENQAKKDAEAIPLDPELKRKYYDPNVKHEKVKINGEEFDIRHSSELNVSYKDGSGEQKHFTATIGTASQAEGTRKGSLILRDSDNHIYFYNPDETLYDPRTNESYTGVNINVAKDVDTVIKDRRYQSLLDTYSEGVAFMNGSIKRLKRLSKESLDYIQNLQQRLNELLEKEAKSLEEYGSKLTRKGTQRVISVKQLVSHGKAVQRVYMNTDEIRKEVEKVKNHIRILKDAINNRKERIIQLNEQREQAEAVGSNVLNELFEAIDTLGVQIDDTRESVDAAADAVNSAENYLKQLGTVLRGYNRTAAKILNIEPLLDEIRAQDISQEEKDAQEASLIAEAIRTKEFQDEPLSDDQLAALSGLEENIFKVREKADKIASTLPQLKNDLKNYDDNLVKYREAFLAHVKTRDNFNERYVENMKKMGIASSSVDKKIRKKFSPESKFPTVRQEEDTKINDYEENYAHVFNDVGSFLVTQGNQEMAKDNDDLARWYVFVNNHAYKGTEKGQSTRILRSVTFDQAVALEENNVLRKKLKFWTGKELKTVDEILQSGDEEALNEAKDDIKVVVVERSSKAPTMVSTGGYLTGDGRTEILYTSLPSANYDKPSGFARFSLKKIKADYAATLKDKGIIKSEEEINQYAEEEIRKEWEKYKAYREDLKNESQLFNIDYVTPGVKVKIDLEERSLDEATGLHFNQMNFYLHSVKDVSEEQNSDLSTTRKISGTEFKLRNGFLYLAYHNRYELVTPKTFGDTGSIDYIIRLLRYLASNPEDYSAVEQYLRQIMYVHYSPDDAHPQHRFFFTRPYRGKQQVTDEIDKIVFGRKEITRQQLLEGENLEDLREFLATKYWNFDRTTINKNSSDFIYFDVKEQKGTFTLESKTIPAKEGGYRKFLFGSTDSGKVKGTIKIAPRQSTPLLDAKKGQYLNQSLSLSAIDSQREGSTRKASEVFGGAQQESAQEDWKPRGKLSNAPPSKTESSVPQSTPSKSGVTRAVDRFANATSTADSNLGSEPRGKLPPRESASEAKDEVFQGPTLQQEEAPAPKTEKRVLTQDQYWDSLTDEKREALLDVFATEEEAKSKGYKMYLTSSKLNRLARNVDNYTKEDINKAKDWFKQHFPDFPIEIVDYLIDNKAWGQLRASSLVLISRLAEEGTIYHEAFHVVSQVFLTDTERNSLYNEVKNSLNRKDMTAAQTEEFLAEEFRSYMLSNGNYKFPATAKIRKNLFQKIWDYIKHLVHKLTGIEETTTPRQVASIFEQIENGEYRLENRKSFKSVTLNSLSNLKEDISVAIVKDVNFNFFQELFDPDNIEERSEILFNDSLDLPDIYNELLKTYRGELALKAIDDGHSPKDLPDDYQPIQRTIVDKWDEIVKYHKRYLLQFGIDIRDEVEEDDRVKSQYSHSPADLVDMTQMAAKMVKLMIAGLPSVTRTSEDTIEPTLSDFHTRSTAEYSKIIRLLNNELAQIPTIEGMFDKMNTMKARYPELSILLKRLRWKESLDGSAMTPLSLRMHAAFYKTFAHNKNYPYVLEMRNDGSKVLIDSVGDVHKQILKNKWLNNAKALSKIEESLVYRDASGEYLVKIDRLLKEISKARAIPDAKIRDRMASYYNILSKLGIVVAPNIEVFTDYKALEDYMTHVIPDLVKHDKLTVQDLFNRDVLKVQKEMNQFLDSASNFLVNDQDLMYFNEKGKPVYQISLNTHLSNTVTRLNNLYDPQTGKLAESPETESLFYLFPYDENKGFGNLFATHSKWWDRLSNGEKINLVLMSGAKAQGVGNANDIRSLNPNDYRAFIFNGLLNNIVPLLRAADRVREYGFKLGDTDTKITDSVFISDLRNYMKDELLTTFAMKLQPDLWGSNLENYSVHAQKLRVFGFMHDAKGFPSFDEFLANELNMEDEAAKAALKVKDIKALVDKFIQDNENVINTELDQFSEELQQKNLDMLIDANVVIPYGKTGVRFYVPGLDTETLEQKFEIHPDSRKTISLKQLNHLVRVATYNYFIGTQEQLKFFVGDLAMFKNPQEVHKRTTGAASTKYNTINSDYYLQGMNKVFPRFDRTKHGTQFNKLVVNDILHTYDDLMEYSNDYANIVSTDAQAWILPDEIRSLKLRNGEWLPSHEKTYQYEMQHLALRILNNPELQKYFPLDESVFTDGVFAKHTGGKIPSKPMYKGEEISLYDLGPLPPTKPQGFGPIGNYPNLAPTQFFKLSAAPVLPSTLPDNSKMFHLILSMMNNGVGVLNSPSSEKGTFITPGGRINEWLDEKTGEIIDLDNPDYDVIQSMNYDNFGLQLDIHDYSSGIVTKSKQRVRLEFLDAFDGGKLLEEHQELAPLHKEYNKLVSLATKKRRQALIDELGLKEDQLGEFSLPEGNVQKFKERLKILFEHRLMPDNAIEGLDLSMDTGEKVFDVLVNRNRIEEVLMALVRNQVINQKTKGDMLVQESSALYSDDLKFYSKDDDGHVHHMEVMVSLPEDWLHRVEKLGGLEEFNRLIQNLDAPNAEDRREAESKLGSDMRKVLLMSANRIPSQHLHSLEAVKIKKFLPHYAGVRIVVPAGIVAKAGSDFDIDKLTTYFKYHTFNKDGTIRYTEFKDNKNSTLADRIEAYIRYEFRKELQTLDPAEKNDFIAEKVKEIAPEFSKWSLEDQNILPAIENRINEISQEALLSPSRFEEFIHPLSSDSVLKELAKEKSQDQKEPTWSDAVQLWYNMQKAEEFWSSKTGTALAVVQNSANATQQAHPIKITNPLIRLYFEGQTLNEGERYRSGHIKDSEGRRISYNFADFLTAFVDVAKDPYIYILNAGQWVFPTYAFLNRFGKNAGVGISTLAYFFTQPIITEFLKQDTRSRALFMRHNQYDPDWSYSHAPGKAAIVDGLFTSLGAQEIKGVPNTYKDTLAYAVEQLAYSEPGSEDRSDWESEVARRLDTYYIDSKGNPKVFNLKKLKGKLSKAEQIQLLDNYLMYNFLGRLSAKLNRVARPDSTLYNNIGAVKGLLKILDSVKNTNFFDNEDIDNLLGYGDSTSILKEFTNTRDATAPMFSWAFLIHKYPTLNNFFEERFIAKYGNPAMYRSPDEINRAIRTIESNFITFIINTAEKPVTQQKEEYRALMTSDSSTAKWLLKLKQTHPNNPLVQELEAQLNPYLPARARNSEVNNIRMFNRRLDVFSQNAMTSGWRELLEDPETTGIAENLIRHALTQSGMTPSPISYTRLIPNNIYAYYAERQLQKFTSLPVSRQLDLLESFEEQMYRNEWENPLIVPRPRKGVYKPYKGTIATTREAIGGVNPAIHQFAAVPYYKVTSARERSKLGQAGLRRIPTEVYLYKWDSSQQLWVLARKFGDGRRFQEYYWATLPEILRGEVQSILPTNEYDFEQTPINIRDPRKPAPRLADDTGEEASLDSINETMSEAAKKGKIQPSLADDTALMNIPENKELNVSVSEFLKSIGVQIEQVEFPGGIPGALGMALLSQKTIQLRNKDIPIHVLPEETAHFYVHLLDKNSGLYKSMTKNIVNYSVYDEVKNDPGYQNFYKGNEEGLKVEAIGKLISRHIINLYLGKDLADTSLSERQEQQVKTWWQALWNYIKRLFGKVDTDGYAKSAYNIMNQKLDDLVLNSRREEKAANMFNPSKGITLNDVFSTDEFRHPDKQVGDVRYYYFKNLDEARELFDILKYKLPYMEENMQFIRTKADKQYAAKIVIRDPRIVNAIEDKTGLTKAQVVKSNSTELRKETPEFDNASEELYRNFEKYYPALEYYDENERRAFIEGLTTGEIEQICGL